LVPEIEKNSIKKISKIELKSTVIKKGDIQVHFSKNEISRIKYFMEKNDKTFCVWLNSKAIPITDEIYEAVRALPKELPFHFDDYILTLGVKNDSL